jgi:catechol 2,3-dioxygenase
VNGRAIRGLGEIALSVNDLDAMQRFYAGVVGLELMARSETSAFFRIAEGYGGHTQVLALFVRPLRPERGSPGTTTLDHLAFEIALADFGSEQQRLEQLGLRVETAEHAWVHWRSLYVTDPEGNRVEFVCVDAAVG